MNFLLRRRRLAFVLIALGSLAAVGGALVSQYAYGLQPCPWCILQRLVFVLIALVALLASCAPGVSRLMAALVALLGVGGAAAAVYQNVVASKSVSCNLSLAERVLGVLKIDAWLPSVFEIRASCADAAANLLGLPFELWSALGFVVVALLALLLALRSR